MFNRSIKEEYKEMLSNKVLVNSLPEGAFRVETQRFEIVESNYFYLLSKEFKLTDDYEKSVEKAHKAIGKGYRHLSIEDHADKSAKLNYIISFAIPKR